MSTTSIPKFTYPTPSADVINTNHCNMFVPMIEGWIDDENLSDLCQMYRDVQNWPEGTQGREAFLDYIDAAILYTEQEWLATK